MKRLKRIAVLSLAILVLGGCTKSSISNEVPVTEAEAEAEVGPGKEDQEEEETIPREQNILIEENTEPESMYDWEQVSDEVESLFPDTTRYPQSVKVEYTANEEAKQISLTWIVKNDTTEEDAMDYAVEMVKRFNDIVAVQTTDLENSSEDSFGSLWANFAVEICVVTEDGTTLLSESYGAGEEIGLVMPEYSGDGPTSSEEENVPKKM